MAMRSIDNGADVRLVIPGYFDGQAGCSRGQVAFIPTGSAQRVMRATAGTIDGRDAALKITRVGEGPMFVASYTFT